MPQSEGNQRWTDQLGEFRQSDSDDGFGLDGESIEFEWNILPGPTSLEIFQQIQKDLQDQNFEQEIQKSAFRIPNKSRITRGDFFEDIGHSLARVMERSGTELSAAHLKKKMRFHRHRDDGTFQRNWSPTVQEHRCFES